MKGMIKEFLKQLNERDDGDISLDDILANDRNKAVYEKWIQVFSLINPMNILSGLSVVSNSIKMAQRDEIILLAYTKFMEQNIAKFMADMPKESFQSKDKRSVNYDGTMFN